MEGLYWDGRDEHGHMKTIATDRPQISGHILTCGPASRPFVVRFGNIIDPTKKKKERSNDLIGTTRSSCWSLLV